VRGRLELLPYIQNSVETGCALGHDKHRVLECSKSLRCKQPEQRVEKVDPVHSKYSSSTASMAASKGSTTAAFPLPPFAALRFGIDLQHVKTTSATTDRSSVMNRDASARKTGDTSSSMEDLEVNSVTGAFVKGSSQRAESSADTFELVKQSSQTSAG
jgi:hypothetical protein